MEGGGEEERGLAGEDLPPGRVPPPGSGGWFTPAIVAGSEMPSGGL